MENSFKNKFFSYAIVIFMALSLFVLPNCAKEDTSLKDTSIKENRCEELRSKQNQDQKEENERFSKLQRIYDNFNTNKGTK